MRIHVTPRAGLSVRDPMHPERGAIPAAGMAADDNSAWRRLARAGDVTITDPAAEAPAAPRSASPAPKK